MITLEQLLADPPLLHDPNWAKPKANGNGAAKPELINQWKLSDEELRFIGRNIGKNSRTLETGAGCSTIVFAMLGSRHTCIVPDQPLADRILAFCKANDISTSNLTFIIDV